jgi:hypothetical protein
MKKWLLIVPIIAVLGFFSGCEQAQPLADVTDRTEAESKTAVKPTPEASIVSQEVTQKNSPEIMAKNIQNLAKQAAEENRPAPSALTSEIKTAVAKIDGAGPKIFSPEPIYDFGTLDNTEKVIHSFTIKNEGTEALEIAQVKTSCGCTIADPPKNKKLAPGEQTEITATLTLTGKTGSQSKAITVMTNDPKTPNYQLKLTGIATTAIMVSDRFINFPKVIDDDPHSDTVKIHTTRDEINFKVTSATIDDESFTTEIEEVTANKDYNVIVTLKGGLPAGSLRSKLTIKTDNPKHPAFPLNVMANIVGDINVVPAGGIKYPYRPDSDKKAKYNVKLSPGRASSFLVTEVELPNGDVQVELLEQAKGSYLIKLSNLPADGQLDGTEMIVRTNLESTPELRIPIHNAKTSRTPRSKPPVKNLKLSGS